MDKACTSFWIEFSSFACSTIRYILWIGWLDERVHVPILILLQLMFGSKLLLDHVTSCCNTTHLMRGVRSQLTLCYEEFQFNGNVPTVCLYRNPKTIWLFGNNHRLNELVSSWIAGRKWFIQAFCFWHHLSHKTFSGFYLKSIIKCLCCAKWYRSTSAAFQSVCVLCLFHSYITKRKYFPKIILQSATIKRVQC